MPAEPSVEIRPAILRDSDAVADVYFRAWTVAMSFVKSAHTGEQVRVWIRDRVIPSGRVLVACDGGGAITGMLAYFEDAEAFWIDQLYVDPTWARRGIGAALLERALALVSTGQAVRLYCFQANEPARRFYEKHGFRAIAYGDGSANEEHCPDVLYERSTTP